MEDFGHHGWGMLWVWILGLILLFLVIWLIIRISDRDRPPAGPTEKSAMDILKEKYARGEISKEDYENRKRDLL